MNERTIYKFVFSCFCFLPLQTAGHSMIKFIQNFLVLFVALLLFTSCEDFFVSEATNVKIPGSEPQLVVYSFISPQDTMIRVMVYRSIPNTMDPRNVPPVFENAHVHLAKKGNAFTQLSYDKDLMAFVINAEDFSVEAGNEYILRVETFSGETVEAECYVPGFEVDTVILFEPTQSIDQWGSFRTIIQWEVHPTSSARERYFRTGAFVKGWEVFENQHQIPIYATPFYLDRGQEYFKQTDDDARIFRATNWGFINLSGGTGNFHNNRIDSIYAFVLQTDYNYFQFHQSVENYFYFDDDFPFSEAVHIYSNIQGGLGVFGGYNQKIYFWAATPQENK